MKLADIAEVASGYTFRERLDAYPDGDVAVLQMKNISPDDKVLTDDLPRVGLADLSARQLLREGDILFRARGHFHTAAVVYGGLKNAVAAAPLMLIRVSTATVLPEYLCWFINHPGTQAKLMNLAAGSYVRTLNKAAIEGMELPLPPVELQRQVVEIAELGRRETKLLIRIAEQRGKFLDGLLARQVQIGFTSRQRRDGG